MPPIVARMILSVALLAHVSASSSHFSYLAYMDIWWDSGLIMATIVTIHMVLAMLAWYAIWGSAIEWTSRRAAITIGVFIGVVILWAATAISLIVMDVGGGSDQLEMMISWSSLISYFIWIAATCIAWANSSASAAAAVTGGDARCPRCGYNLAKLTSTRCPECGCEPTIDLIVGEALARQGHLKAVFATVPPSATRFGADMQAPAS